MARRPRVTVMRCSWASRVMARWAVLTATWWVAASAGGTARQTARSAARSAGGFTVRAQDTGVGPNLGGPALHQSQHRDLESESGRALEIAPSVQARGERGGGESEDAEGRDRGDRGDGEPGGVRVVEPRQQPGACTGRSSVLRPTTNPSRPARREPALPASANPMCSKALRHNDVRRACLTVKPSNCSANVRTGQSWLSQKNRRTCNRNTTGWPATGLSASPR